MSARFYSSKFIIMLDHVPILLAEDDPNEVFLMQRAMKRAAVPNPVFIVSNGQEVIDYLSGKGDYRHREKFPLPGLMLLDLRMPWMDGFDVLRWLRGQPQFGAVRVVVLTSSKLQSDMDKSRQMGAYDFRVKPHEFDDLVQLVDDVWRRWSDEQGRLSGTVVDGSPAKSPNEPQQISRNEKEQKPEKTV